MEVFGRDWVATREQRQGACTVLYVRGDGGLIWDGCSGDEVYGFSIYFGLNVGSKGKRYQR